VKPAGKVSLIDDSVAATAPGLLTVIWYASGASTTPSAGAVRDSFSCGAVTVVSLHFSAAPRIAA
jgi:hypothetical protein